MKEYKVLTQSDSFWAGATDAGGIEAGLNRLARDGWELKSTIHGDGWSWRSGARGQVVIILEREHVDTSMREPTGASDGTYNTALIPADRYYVAVGNVSSALREAGLVTKQQLDAAREEFARRGGHLCDHLLATGAVDNDRLLAFFREHFGVGAES